MNDRKIITKISFFAIAAFILLITSNIQAQLFQQDFSSSTTVSSYVSATPSNGQFNAIGSTAGTTVSINNGALQYVRTGGSGTFSRTTDFSPTPTSLIYKVDINVSGNNAATTTAATFQVGANYGTTNSTESNANTYARFAINLSANPGCFFVRDISSSTNSAEFCGTQSITWILNNTGATFTYNAPDGTPQTLPNDTADIYVGTTLVFNNFSVLTPTQIITDLKFVFSAGVGTIQLDNILVDPVPSAPTIASPNNATFTVGQAGTFTITTTGIPNVTAITLSGDALPAGVSFTDNGNGTATLSGTPVNGANGTYNLVFTASNGVLPNAVQNFTLMVALAPSAAPAQVSGRVTQQNGNGISRALVTMIDSQGIERSVYTDRQGLFTFEDVPAGQVYVFSVSHLRYRFDLPTQVQFIGEDFTGINFVGTSSGGIEQLTPRSPVNGSPKEQ